MEVKNSNYVYVNLNPPVLEFLLKAEAFNYLYLFIMF